MWERLFQEHWRNWSVGYTAAATASKATEAEAVEEAEAEEAAGVEGKS